MTREKMRLRDDVYDESIILHYLNRFTAWLYTLILSSAIGRFMTGYSRTQDAFRAERELSAGEKVKRSDRLPFRIRMKFSALTERSLIARLLNYVQNGLLCCGASSYGVFFLFFGVYTVVAYYIRNSIVADAKPVSYAIIGGLMILISLPMFASRATLASLLRSSLVFHFLLVDFLGIREERFSRYGERGHDHYLMALFAGVIGGSLTFLFSPQQMLTVTGILIFFWVVFRYPEVGMTVSIVAAPFLAPADHPTMILLILVAASFLSFLIKLACGKRVLRMEIADWLVLLFAALIFAGGFASMGGSASRNSALAYVCLMMIYFLVANLARSQEGIRRTVVLLLISCTVVALIGLWQYFFSEIAVDYLDLDLFGDLGGRVYSVFANPNVLAEYLVLMLPLWFALLTRQRRLLRIFGCVLGIGIAGLCLIFTWTRGAWLGFLISMILFFLLLDHRALSWMLLGVLPAAALLRFIPEKVARRFVSIGNPAESSIHYRLNLWKGVREMLADHWFSGVGVGEIAFCEVYPAYALPGVESAMHSHNLYLQIFCALGIIGLIVFVGAMLLWTRRALEYYRFSTQKESRAFVLGGIAGIAALLVMGCFDHIWYNYRIFFLFWTVMGLVSAQIRVGRTEAERATNPVDDERTQSEVTLYFR